MSEDDVGHRSITLRPQRSEDLALLVGGDTPFDSFGPVAPRSSPADHDLEQDGALTVTDGEDVVGEVGWHWQRYRYGPNAASSCPMIGIHVVQRHRGRGVGSAAQAEMVRLLFAHTTTHRVEAHTDVDNVAEQSALERAGFQREGVTRGAQWRDGAHRDGVMYAVLRSDPAVLPVRPVLLAGPQR